MSIPEYVQNKLKSWGIPPETIEPYFNRRDPDKLAEMTCILAKFINPTLITLDFYSKVCGYRFPMEFKALLKRKGIKDWNTLKEKAFKEYEDKPNFHEILKITLKGTFRSHFSKVYREVFKRGRVKATEIASILNIPREKAWYNLHHLNLYGLVKKMYTSVEEGGRECQFSLTRLSEYLTPENLEDLTRFKKFKTFSYPLFLYYSGREVSTREMADIFRSEIHTVGNVLRKLEKRGILISRKRGGNRFHKLSDRGNTTFKNFHEFLNQVDSSHSEKIQKFFNSGLSFGERYEELEKMIYLAGLSTSNFYNRIGLEASKDTFEEIARCVKCMPPKKIDEKLEMFKTHAYPILQCLKPEPSSRSELYNCIQQKIGKDTNTLAIDYVLGFYKRMGIAEFDRVNDTYSRKISTT